MADSNWWAGPGVDLKFGDEVDVVVAYNVILFVDTLNVAVGVDIGVEGLNDLLVDAAASVGVAFSWWLGAESIPSKEYVVVIGTRKITQL